jgi:hypothetical protein
MNTEFQWGKLLENIYLVDQARNWMTEKEVMRM